MVRFVHCWVVERGEEGRRESHLVIADAVYQVKMTADGYDDGQVCWWGTGRRRKERRWGRGTLLIFFFF